MLVLVVYYPTVLHLSRAAIRADYTVNLNNVTCNRLCFKSVVAYFSVCTVSAVNGEFNAVIVLDVHITVGSVVYFLDSTNYIVLIGSVRTAKKNAECVCLSNSKNGVCSGKDNLGATLFITYKVAVRISAVMSGNKTGVCRAASTLAAGEAVLVLTCGDPTVLHLRSRVIRADYTVNGDSVACNRLLGHRAVASFTG